MRCPAAIRLEELCPEQEQGTHFQEEGTAAHELAAICLDTDTNTADHFGKKVYKDFVVDDEMAENVQAYLDEVRSRHPEELFVETKLDLTDWVPDGFGTGDAISFKDDTLYVDDLKYGRGVEVYAEDNEQLMLYGLGAYREHELLYDIKNVSLGIHQPRRQHLDTHVIPVEELLAFGEKVKVAALHALDNSEAPIAGDKQCLWCRAKAICPAATKKVAEDVGMDFEDLTSNEQPFAHSVELLSGQELSNMYSKLDFIEGWCKTVRGRMYEALENGEDGTEEYILTAGRRGARAWISEEEVKAMIKSMRLKHDEAFNSKLKSPAQMEKVLKSSKKRWSRAEKLIVQGEGKPTIVRADSGKIPVNNVKSDFDDLMG
jgi:hypothetical protein